MAPTAAPPENRRKPAALPSLHFANGLVCASRRRRYRDFAPWFHGASFSVNVAFKSDGESYRVLRRADPAIRATCELSIELRTRRAEHPPTHATRRCAVSDQHDSVSRTSPFRSPTSSTLA